MNPHSDNHLTFAERLTILGLSCGFGIVVTFLGYVFVATSIMPGETAWSFYFGACHKTLIAFWDSASDGKVRTAGGILVGGFGYLIGLPLIWFTSAYGLFTGVRGKRSRFANWILRQASSHRPKSLESTGEARR